MKILVIGATGFVGRRLAAEMIDRGHEVACVVRDRQSEVAEELGEKGCELCRADLADPDSLEPALVDIDVVYYLAHLMSADGDADLTSAETAAARGVARAAKRARVELMVYLGGLGDESVSDHLGARARTAEVLRAEGPPLVYFRAAMIVGAESESYVLLDSIVERLPAMITPEWLDNRTQPIGIDDVVKYLAEVPLVEAARGAEIQLGGPEVITYSEMLDGLAVAQGKKPLLRLPTPPGIAAKAAGRLAATLTRGEPRVAELLTAGLATDTLVDDPSGMALFDIEPETYRLSLGRAEEDKIRAEEDEEASP